MKDISLTFRPIQLPAHDNICVQFTTDAFICSFGDASKFLSGSNHYLSPEKYLDWLQEKLDKAPESAVHVWKGSEIIGQMEFGVYRHNPKVGYVHLYYLVPHMRGKGISKYLDEYACDYLRRMGHSQTRLSVTKINERAINYYTKHEWQEVGESPDDSDVVIMEKYLH